MDLFFEFTISHLAQSLVLSLVTLGVMIPYRILNLPDFTAEASYPFAGITCAYLIVLNIHPGFATFIGSIIGGILGLMTAFLHLRLRINSLISGIILSGFIYSLDTRFIANLPSSLEGSEHLFSNLGGDEYIGIAILLGINLIIIIPIIFYFYTEKGLAVRVAGKNPDFAEKNGINIAKSKIIGLFLANVLIGLAGSILIQIENTPDASTGFGILIQALASLMIGEALLPPARITLLILAPILGSIVFYQLESFVILLGFAESDIHLIAALCLAALYAFRKAVN